MTAELREWVAARMSPNQRVALLALASEDWDGWNHHAATVRALRRRGLLSDESLAALSPLGREVAELLRGRS